MTPDEKVQRARQILAKAVAEERVLPTEEALLLLHDATAVVVRLLRSEARRLRDEP